MKVPEAFWVQVDRSGGPDACWPWTGPIRNQKGYGKFRVDGKDHVAHQWLLGELRGVPLVWPHEIARHCCDNPPCCNPAHLLTGTVADNVADAIARSGHPAAARRAQTHCKRGHEFTPANTFVSTGRRYCKVCHSSRTAAAHRRRRERIAQARVPCP